MTFECGKCRQPYALAVLGRRLVWMAVEPWASGLCGRSCSIDARRSR